MNTAITRILDELRRGVDDQTWQIYAQHLTALGARPSVYEDDEHGRPKYEIPIGPGHAVHVERRPDGLWHLA